MSLAVVAEGLTKRIGDFTAVDSVSFSVPEGQIYGFLGSNGAGKTTTIRMLCGIILPTEGAGSILGMDIVRQRDEIKENIGYMSQKFSLYEDLTVKENLEFFAGMYRIRGRRSERIKEALESTDLSDRAETITSELPHGLKQRLALASANLHKPRILFLDEPTAGVDPAARREFWKLINELSSEGITVFVTTHYMDEAEHCHQIALLHEGRIRAGGSPTELKQDVMEGFILEILCNDPAGGIGALRRAGLGETALFANAIHLNVADLSTGTTRAKEILASEDIEVHSMENVSASLEDVFLSVLSRPEDEQNGHAR